MSAQPPYRPPSSPPPGYPPRRSNTGWIIAGAVVALIIIGGIGYWLGGRNNASTAAPGPSAPATAPSGSAPSDSSAPSATAAASLAPSASAQPSASTAPSAPPSTVASPTKKSASPSPTVTPFTHPDPDFGYVTGVVAGPVTKLTFDRATLLTGKAAAAAAKAHGQQVDDDYFIVNDNPLIRTFPLSPSVVVVGSSNLSGDVGPTPSTLAALEAWVSANPKLKLPVDLSYDLTGTVTTITEHFFP
jgi:hypothetical protein